jgi:RimJ/RimL family protein N-acetyltransferase
MLNGKLVSLYSKTLSDAPRDYRWQTDRELMQLNGSIPLDISFIQYVTCLKSGTQQSGTRFFSIKTISDGRHIGNCAIYDTDPLKQETSIGILIGERDCWGQGYGQDAIKILTGYIFNGLKLNCINLKTLETNIRAIHCFNKCGFTTNGRSYIKNAAYVLMKLSYSNYASFELNLLNKSTGDILSHAQVI